MIVYNLACSAGHEFEGWFKDSAAYEAQAAARGLSCPACGDAGITKAIMAPSVKNSVTKAKGANELNPAAQAQHQEKLRQFAAGFRKFVEENAEYVGPKFPEEARKIHYGDAEERGIYGETTLAEAKDLIEEGIDVAPMPPDPNELN